MVEKNPYFLTHIAKTGFNLSQRTRILYFQFSDIDINTITRHSNKISLNLEPVGSVGPRLTSGDKIRTIDAIIKTAYTMLCPAQSFPVPSFR